MSFTPAHLRPDQDPAFSLFPGNLRYLRKRRGLNQEDISALFNKKANTVGNWENGKTEPSIPELLVISGYFGVNLEDLLRSEIRKRQEEDEKQLSLWPDQAIKAADPARVGTLRTPTSFHSGINDYESTTYRQAGQKPPVFADTLQNAGAIPCPKTGNETTGPAISDARLSPEAPATGGPFSTADSAASPGGEALWFMLRELRLLQERLDKLQSAFDYSAGRRPADKSDH